MSSFIRFLEDVRSTPDPLPALSVVAALIFLLVLIVMIFRRSGPRATESAREADLRELFRLAKRLEDLPPGFSDVELAAVSALNKQRNMIQAIRAKESDGENPAPGVLR